MKGFYLLIDEFNTVILANLLAWRLKADNPTMILATVCDPDYVSMFSHFDKLFFLSEKETNENPVDLLVNNPSHRERKLNNANKLLGDNNIEVLHFADVSHFLIREPGEGIHKTVLVNSIDYLVSKGAMISASNVERVLAEEFIKESRIAKEFVVVIGRNRKVHPEHNNRLTLQILKNLILGRPVVNATFPNPDLKLGRLFKKYFELPPTLSEYGVTVALMENARETIAIGNAGGIGVHMMTSAKIRVVGQMNWVNGADFTLNGLTLYSARKLVGIETTHTWFGEKPRNILSAIQKTLRL